MRLSMCLSSNICSSYLVVYVILVLFLCVRVGMQPMSTVAANHPHLLSSDLVVNMIAFAGTADHAEA